MDLTHSELRSRPAKHNPAATSHFLSPVIEAQVHGGASVRGRLGSAGCRQHIATAPSRSRHRVPPFPVTRPARTASCAPYVSVRSPADAPACLALAAAAIAAACRDCRRRAALWACRPEAAAGAWLPNTAPRARAPSPANTPSTSPAAPTRGDLDRRRLRLLRAPLSVVREVCRSPGGAYTLRYIQKCRR